MFDSNYFYEIEGLGQKYRTDSYELYRHGGSCSFGYYFDDYTDIYLKYRSDFIDVGHTGLSSDINFKNAAGRSRVAGISLGFETKTINDSKYPTKGSHTRADFECAGRGLGGDYDFNLVNIDSAWYFTPWKDRELTFVLHGHSDWEDDFGPTPEVPFFERFYAGGASTIRGYRSRTIGPQGTDDEAIGGKFRMYFNFEMRFPFYKDIKQAVFFDSGGVWKKITDFNGSGFASGVGWGLRYVLTWWKVHGVARLDYGIALNRRPKESAGRIYATFGIPF